MCSIARSGGCRHRGYFASWNFFSDICDFKVLRIAASNVFFSPAAADFALASSMNLRRCLSSSASFFWMVSRSFAFPYTYASRCGADIGFISSGSSASAIFAGAALPPLAASTRSQSSAW